MEHLAGVQPQGESVAQDSLLGLSTGPWLILADGWGVGVLLTPGSVTSARRCERPGHSRTILRARGRRRIFASIRNSRRTFADASRRRCHPVRPSAAGLSIYGALTLGSLRTPTVASLNRAQRLGCCSVLQLVQELVRVQGSGHSRLWLITRGAQAAGQKRFALGRRSGATLGVGSRHRPGASDALGRPDRFGQTDRIRDPDISQRDTAASQLLAEISGSGWRGPDCIS